jgi:hypothetical protein
MLRMTRSTLAALLFSWIAFGQNAGIQPASSANAPAVKSADLPMDAEILRKAFEPLHPGLYRYNNKSEMDARFEALKRDLSHDQSLQEAFLAFSVFAAHVKCGHTYPNFFNQKETIAAALFHGQNRVPFYFRWLDQRMVVT